MRQEYDWSQSDLAERVSAIGVSVNGSTISKIETSQRDPSAEMLAALAKVLGTTTDYLLMLSEDPLPREEDWLLERELAGELDVNEPMLRTLLETISRLSRTDQALLLNFAERLAAANQPRIIGGDEDG
jgi:transcriptional regulator with XRE-family HTH domain